MAAGEHTLTVRAGDVLLLDGQRHGVPRAAGVAAARRERGEDQPWYAGFIEALREAEVGSGRGG